MLELVTKNTLPEYENFISSHSGSHFLQSHLWSRQKPDWTWEGIITRNESGEINGAMSVLIRKAPYLPYSLMYAARGPVCDLQDKATLEKLTRGAVELSKKYRAFCLKLDPDVRGDDESFINIMRDLGYRHVDTGKNFSGIQPRFVFRLNISGKTKDEIFKEFHSKTRYNIRVSERKGVEVLIKGEEALDDFSKIMLETGVRDGFMVRSREYFKRMLDSLGENARLYMAYCHGTAVAGTLAIRYGDKVWYLYGASSNKHRNLMPNYLLQWRMIEWAVESGCGIYDFRGVSGDLSEDNPLYGLYRFKKGFGGEFVEFAGEFDYIFNPAIYWAASKGEKLLRKLRKNVFLFKNNNS